MAQNIALNKSSQSTFAKALKNIKMLMKEKEITMRNFPIPLMKKVMGRKPRHRPNSDYLGRGVVYLSHIPKGFYEEEMLKYFNQFGLVTRLNLVRSKVTGKPKGYAFIEFRYSEVAQVVAETMNNYLMFGKILKAEYIPGNQIRRGMFASSKVRPENCERTVARNKWIEKTNRLLTDKEVSEMAVRELKQLDKFKKKLQSTGIDFDCQVEGDAITILNNPDALVLEMNEIKTEVEHSVSPPLQNRKRSLSTSSTASTPEKKRMTLLQSLKSKKQSPVQSPDESPTSLDRTPILRLKRLDQFSSRSTEKLNKSSSMPPNKGRSYQLSSRSAEKLKKTPCTPLSKQRLDQLSSKSAEKLKNSPCTPLNKEKLDQLSSKSAMKLNKSPSTSSNKKRLNPLSTKSAEKLKNSPRTPLNKEKLDQLSSKSAMKLKKSPSLSSNKKRLNLLSTRSAEKLKNSLSISPSKENLHQLSSKSTKKQKKSPSISPNKENSSPKQTPEKTVTPKISSASKKTPRDKKLTKTPILSVKKRKSPGGSNGKQSIGSVKKAKTPVSAKKGKKSPLLVGRRLALSTTKKTLASRLTKKTKPIKMKTP